MKYLLPLFVLGLIFSSCEKDRDHHPRHHRNYDSTVTFNDDQNVLFLYEVSSTQNDDVSGWFVTNEGTLRSFDSQEQYASLLPSGSSCSSEEINRLANLGESTDLNIDGTELRTQFELFANNSATLTTEVNQEDQNLTKALYGIVLNRSHNHDQCDGCKDDDLTSNTPENFNLVLLKKSGEKNQYSTNQAHQEVVEWLESLASEAGL